jgi:phosphate transport system substrate-binding protein
MKSKLFALSTVLVILAVGLAACAPVAAPMAEPTSVPTVEVVVPTAVEQAAPTTVPTEVPAAPMEEGTLPEVDPGSLTGDIYSAGSSTVYPLSEQMVLMFADQGFTGENKLDSIGSGAGLERFCKTGETDIANASRAIKDSEVESCKAINRTPIEFRVGTDALAVVVSTENDFLTNVTMEELAKIFSSEAVLWSDVNSAYPAEPIQRFVPGTDSGTYDYFIEAVMLPVYGVEDKENAAKVFLEAQNLSQSEDDNVLVQGVEGSKYAIGFFGFAYFNENQDLLKAVSVDGVAPGFESAESGEYKISRPLFIYSDAEIMKSKPQVAAFINFYLTNVNDIITEVGYFPASDDALQAARQAWLDAMK